MEIERIEDWIGREVVDAEGQKVGKLDEVYFRGDDAVIGEVKVGVLTRKRVLVPLEGAAVTRDSVRVTGTVEGETDGLEPSGERSQRLADVAEAERRAQEADAEAARRQVDAEDAAQQAQAAAQAAADAAEARRIAAARVERVKSRGPDAA
jgi:sporulation protein YlmC with PRC-barrel domain